MKTKIIRVAMGKSNAYLLKGNEGFILIDAGMPGKIDSLIKSLSAHNSRLEDIKLIIVTHVHKDHVGSLQDIQKRSNALVLVHKKEKDILQKGYSKFPKGTMAFSRFLSGLANKILFSKDQFKPVSADIFITDNFDLTDYGLEGRIIHTPGHTEGSISVIIENKFCFTGDTLFNIFPSSVYPPFANNEKELLESWKRLRKNDCIKYFPSHGREFGINKFDKTIKKHLIQ